METPKPSSSRRRPSEAHLKMLAGPDSKGCLTKAGDEREKSEESIAPWQLGSPDLHDDSQDSKGQTKAGKEGIALWDLGSPLYDSFELVSLSHLLDRKLMSFTGCAGGSETLTGWFSEASSTPSSKGEAGKTQMELLSRLMGLTPRKRRVQGESRKERTKKIKASFCGLCGSFTFWRK